MVKNPPEVNNVPQIKEIKKRGRPPKIQTLCQDANEMTQAEEKPKKVESINIKSKNIRKLGSRGKYNKKTKVLSSISDKSENQSIRSNSLSESI